MVGKPGGMFGFLEALCTHTYLYLSFLHSLFKFLQSCSFPCCSTATVLTVRRLYLNYPNECVLTYRNPYLLAAPPPVFDILSSLNLQNAILFLFSSNCFGGSKQSLVHAKQIFYH